LTLHDESGPLCSNSYVAQEEKDRDLNLLEEQHGCLALSLLFAWQEGEQRSQAVQLGWEWAPLLCGDLALLSAEGRAWWRQWLQPGFGRLGARAVDRAELRRRLAELEAAYPEAEERVRGDCQALRALLARADGPLQALTADAYTRLVEQRPGNG
jgi:hypothetical protein